jgi:cytosine/adenosine deaminase-related metal-dependent hydrolase
MDHLIGSLEVGKKADVVVLKNDASPAMYPILNPYGHVVFQAQRGDVHTVVVDGRLVKSNGALVDGTSADLATAKVKVGETVDFLRETLGADAWAAGMNPDIPPTKVLDNPYQYTDFASGATHGQEG